MNTNVIQKNLIEKKKKKDLCIKINNEAIGWVSGKKKKSGGFCYIIQHTLERYYLRLSYKKEGFNN